MTEAGAVASNGKKRPDVQVKLKDVADMGYTSLDKPFSRGVLWVKTKEMSTGYFRDSENTGNNFDDDGFFNTGDVQSSFLFYFIIIIFFEKRLWNMMKKVDI